MWPRLTTKNSFENIKVTRNRHSTQFKGVHVACVSENKILAPLEILRWSFSLLFILGERASVKNVYHLPKNFLNWGFYRKAASPCKSTSSTWNLQVKQNIFCFAALFHCFWRREFTQVVSVTDRFLSVTNLFVFSLEDDDKILEGSLDSQAGMDFSCLIQKF